jgi:hypothetical protein
MHAPVSSFRQTREGRNQSPVLGHVVGGDADGAVKLLQRAAARILDVDTVTGRTGIAPGPSVDVHDNGVIRHQRFWVSQEIVKPRSLSILNCRLSTENREIEPRSTTVYTVNPQSSIDNSSQMRH